MSYLIDTNVLLRLAKKDHPMSPDARRALVTLRKQGERLCITGQNLIEFWAVATRPVENNGLGLSIEEAARVTGRIKQLLKFLPDTSEIFIAWERLVIEHQVKGKPSHDARLVAAMVAHQITHLLTFNVNDFKRYTIITAVNPHEI
jgi:predicted nucleic acid-binding protein